MFKLLAISFKENRTFLKIIKLMQIKTEKEEISVWQQYKRIAVQRCKNIKNSKILQGDEIDTLTLANQFKCLE